MRRHTDHHVRKRLRATVGCFALAASVSGCGGGGGSAPTSPSPTPPSGVSACNVIGGATGALTAIVNGTACSTANSSVVLVNMRDNSGPIGSCSGTVIAPRAVLTAAHCLVGGATAVRIFVGTGSEVPAESFLAHPLYRQGDSSSVDDVGVVITGQDLPRTPFRLLLSRDARSGEQAVIAGWGADQNGNGTILRAGTTTITVTSNSGLQTQQNSTNSGVCSGDSGGPLLLSEGGVWAIAGVTSATTTGGSCFANTNFYANLRNPDVMSFILAAVPNAVRQ
jgi:secreted trypsin-like serine protease